MIEFLLQRYAFPPRKPKYWPKNTGYYRHEATAEWETFSKFAAMKKKKLTIFAFAMAALLASCDKHDQAQNYQLNITLDNKLRHDSATLMVLEEEYNQLRVCGTAQAKDGTFTFTGQTDKPKVALIRWDNDSVNPFYLVLESGNIDVTIKSDHWDITGSPLNSAYLHYINQRNGIMNARVATWQEYLKMAADSSLKHEDEVLMVRQDSLLNDSLQRITVELINRGDAVGRIIRERYAHQLDQEHVRMLK